jgi:hypothetical protein
MPVATSHARTGEEARAAHGEGRSPYLRLAAMTALSFLAMYALMYAMVDRFENVFPNFNQAYMAGLMAASMVIIELVLMRSMYPSNKWNVAIGAASSALLVLCWLLIRRQTAIGDEQFLKSMIPHHAGAILMCQQASLSDPGIEELCRSIVSSQRQEIELMKSQLEGRRRS